LKATEIFQGLINLLYRHPLSDYHRIKRSGGFVNHYRTWKGQKAMVKASFLLSPITSFDNGYPIYFLTGKNYLHQTLFCIQSLVKASQAEFRYILVDDGSFDNAIINHINKQLPGCIIITAETIAQNLKQVLPESKYPVIHAKRKIYPHLKKLTDIHTIPTDDWKLVLDSDMLFWNEPGAIINWLDNPDHPIHMLDCVESYGYSHQLMKQLCNDQIPDSLNVGVIGLNRKTINWLDVENWIAELEKKEGASYYLEQALTAMLVGSSKCTILNAGAYIVNPRDLNDPADILHHYVDLSKAIYYQQAWQKLIN
jgi:hypothetical protein